MAASNLNWLKKIATSVVIDMGSYLDNLRKYMYDLADRSQGSRYEYTREDADSTINSILLQSQENINKLENIVQQAIQSLQWNGSPVVIKAAGPPSESTFFGPDYFKPVTDAYISVGSSEFTLFMEEGKIEIDDVLEADDADFFVDNRIRQDYFNLVRALKNLGKAPTNRVLVLYTARPIEDRKIYEGATQVPSNIYLTSSYSSAEGIALDLRGQSKMRDIWKVRIEEKYLIETLNNGIVREYQVVGNGMVPVKGITLISPGE